MKQQYINFKRERPFGDKINATFAFLSQNMKPLLTNMLFVAGPFAVVAGICFSIYQSFLVAEVGKTIQQQPEVSQYIMLGVAMILMCISMLIATTMVVAIVQRLMRHYVEQGNAELTPSYFWNNIWDEFFSVLGSSFGIVLLMGIALGCVGTPLVLLAMAMEAPFMFVFIMLGALIAIMLIGSALMLIYPIRNFERKGFMQAISRLYALNQGKWWSTAGLMFVMYVIQSTVMTIFMVPMYVMMMVQMLHTQDVESTMVNTGVGILDVLGAVVGSLSMLGYTMSGTLYFIAITFQYFNLRERREASGLLERMESFGVAQPVHEEEEQY